MNSSDHTSTYLSVVHHYDGCRRCWPFSWSVKVDVIGCRQCDIWCRYNSLTKVLQGFRDRRFEITFNEPFQLLNGCMIGESPLSSFPRLCICQSSKDCLQRSDLFSSFGMVFDPVRGISFCTTLVRMLHWSSIDKARKGARCCCLNSGFYTNCFTFSFWSFKLPISNISITFTARSHTGLAKVAWCRMESRWVL